MFHESCLSITFHHDVYVIHAVVLLVPGLALLVAGCGTINLSSINQPTNITLL